MKALDHLVANWREAGLQLGDTVVVHSSVRRTLQLVSDLGAVPCLELVLASFREAVGPEGTLLFPTFNYGFTQGQAFDVRTTPSEMGLLSEAARSHPSAVRTQHPIFSFAVSGPRAAMFQAATNRSGWGADSPFALLRELDAKTALLDCLNATTIHHAEEMSAVPYRFHKDFSGRYRDENGREDVRTYSFYARRLDMGVVNYLDPIKEMLWDSGVLSGCRPGTGHGLGVARVRDVFDFVTEVIQAGRAEGLLFRIEHRDAAD